jgi:uncharacterized protein (DUF4415 family)
MNRKNSGKSSQSGWEKLATMPDSKIDLSETPELDSTFFQNAVLRLPKPKKAVSLRLDDDVFQWFRSQGKGYQTKMNAVLRLYMHARSKPSSHSRTTKNIKSR